MVFLILESLGSTELIFILVMALVFFGPRKLPQLSRSLGKNLASFRRASEDFKRTWDREVTMEELNATSGAESTSVGSDYNDVQAGPSLPAPTIEAVPADRIIPRGQDEHRTTAAVDSLVDNSEPSPKREWL